MFKGRRVRGYRGLGKGSRCVNEKGKIKIDERRKWVNIELKNKDKLESKMKKKGKRSR